VIAKIRNHITNGIHEFQELDGHLTSNMQRTSNAKHLLRQAKLHNGR